MISSPELIRMATIDGAKALGLEHDTGSLEIGKSADIIALDISGPGYSDCPQIEALIVYSGSGRDVTNVWVSGERLVHNRNMTRRAYSEIRADYKKAYTTFWERVQKAKKVN